MSVKALIVLVGVAMAWCDTGRPVEPLQNHADVDGHGMLHERSLRRNLLGREDNLLSARDEEVSECKKKVEKIQAQMNILNTMMDSTYSIISDMDHQLKMRSSAYQRDTIQQCLTGVEDICDRFSSCCHKDPWTCNQVHFTVTFKQPFHTKPQRAAVSIISIESESNELSYDMYFDESKLSSTSITIRFEPMDNNVYMKRLKVRWMACA